MLKFENISEYELLNAAFMTILKEWESASKRAMDCNWKVESYNRIEDKLWNQLREIRARLDEIYEERRAK